MKVQVLIIWILCVCIQILHSIEPLTTSLAIGGALLAGATYQLWDDNIKCQFSECCSMPYWITFNVTRFEENFDTFIYGQHIARNVISKALRSHLRKGSKSKKALVISFHGWTGTGKNYVADQVAKSIFHNGLKSKFMHKFIATVDFPDPTKIDIYKIELQKIIMEKVRSCHATLFIFDEVDKLPKGLIDAIKPFIDYHEAVQGLDFRQTIFIFLSNTGGSKINEVALEAWKSGKTRESLQYKDLENVVQAGAFNEIGGLHESAVIDKHLVDWYVPFLPLERKHVLSCIVADARNKNATIVLKSDEIESILDELTFHPADFLIYSTTGCKTISPKVDILLEEILNKEDGDFA